MAASAGTIWFWMDAGAAPPAANVIKLEPRRLIRKVTRKSSRSPS